jgi:hypothetical protein
LPLPARPTPPHRKLSLAAKGAGAFVIAAAGFVAAVYQNYGGPPWPTAPDIHPNPGASNISVPLEVHNRSGLFEMTAHLSCTLDMLFFIDAKGRTGLLRDASFSQGGVLSLPPKSVGNLPCDPSRFVQVREDGSVIMGFSNDQNLQTKPGAFVPPIKILKVCLIAGGTYRAFWADRSFASQMFQWPAEPNQPVWLEGPTINDDDQSKWIPPGSTVGAAWALRSVTMMGADGKTDALRADALKCDTL